MSLKEFTILNEDEMTKEIVYHCTKCGKPIRRSMGSTVKLAQSYAGSNRCKTCDNYDKNAHVRRKEH